jgi:hypothetical protein
MNVQTNNGQVAGHTINNNQVYNITIMPYDKTSNQIIAENPAAYSKYITDNIQGFLNYTRDKHFSAEHPEANNLRKETKRDDFVDIYDGNTWIPITILDFIKQHLFNYSLLFDDIVEQKLETVQYKEAIIKDLQYTLKLLKSFEIPIDLNLERITEIKINRSKIVKTINDYLYKLTPVV